MEDNEIRQKPVKVKKHGILNHPVFGYFVLMVFVEIFTGIFGYLDGKLGLLIPGYSVTVNVMEGFQVTVASGVMTAIGALVAAGIFKRHFRPDFKGCFSKSMFWTGIGMLAVFLILHVFGSVVSIMTFGVGNVFIAFLRCTAPGFAEEITYRGLGVANYMRTIKDEKKIPVILWLSAIVFGFVHVLNVFAGAELGVSIMQAIYACGIGVLFGAVYLRTGNLWPTVIAHCIVDFAEFCRLDMNSSGGVMVNMGLGDWITMIVGFGAAFAGLFLVRKKKYPEIMRVWRQKWNRPEIEEITETAV